MSAPTLAEVMAAISTRLAKADVRWHIDLQSLAIPGVLIPVPTLSYRFGRDSVDATFVLVAVVNNTGRRPAVEALSDLVSQVLDALAGMVTELRPVELTTADQTALLLAAELPLALSLTAPTVP
jgi:hypothetical protein